MSITRSGSMVEWLKLHARSLAPLGKTRGIGMTSPEASRAAKRQVLRRKEHGVRI